MQSDPQAETTYTARNYAPLPVALVKGEGSHVWDAAGRRYLDMMGAYSAVSHGHCHPRLVKALADQAGTLGVVSRAYEIPMLEKFLKRACELTGMDMALPMNTGAEAVETALKAARKWAYTVKGVPAGKAEIIACDGNFHGRTITIVGMSSEPQYQNGFGPFPPGFKCIPFGDIAALAAAITPRTAAFLVEPIQGEGGIIVPPDGYLAECARLCRRHNVLLLVDEIQTGLGRTGKLLAAEHDGVRPDGLMLGKALGGGLLPVSLFLARREVMEVFTPGDHGSTFGGYPLAAAVGLEALDILIEDDLIQRSADLGDFMFDEIARLPDGMIADVRGRGLFAGIEFHVDRISARSVCTALLDRGVLTMYTGRNTMRLAPPLVITESDIAWAVGEIEATLGELARGLEDAQPVAAKSGRVALEELARV